MEMLKDIRDIIETDIEPYKPGAAKALKILSNSASYRDRFNFSGYSR